MDGPARRLLGQRVRATLRAGHYSHLTERAYIAWIRRFIEFHRGRDPAELAPEEVGAYLTHLAVDRKVHPLPKTSRSMRCSFSTVEFSA